MRKDLDEMYRLGLYGKRRGRRNDSGKAKSGRGRRFIFESGKCNSVTAEKIMIFNVMFRFYKMETR